MVEEKDVGGDKPRTRDDGLACDYCPKQDASIMTAFHSSCVLGAPHMPLSFSSALVSRRCILVALCQWIQHGGAVHNVVFFGALLRDVS